MKFENHIAKRFLTDDNFLFEIIEETYPEQWKESLRTGEPCSKIQSLYAMLSPKDTKTYYVTETVLDQLDMLKVVKKGDHYDWTVFKDKIENERVTFIFPGNKLLRMIVQDELIMFCHCQFTLHLGDKNNGTCNWILFYLNRETGELCEHFNHPDVKQIETFYYALLCFMYLTDNDEVVIPPGRSHGTRRQGKVLNDLPLSLTVVNSRWNITSIRTEGFGVRGHFRVQPCGAGRTDSKLVFIEPFEKNGYIRRAGKLIESEI